MARLNIYALLGVPTSRHFDPEHKFVTSPFLRSPFTLAAFRITIAFYTLFTLIFTLVWKAVREHDADSYFSYFTYLTYIGICAYYFASSTQTLAYTLGRRRKGAGTGYPLQRWPRPLQAMHVVLQATVTSFPILVTIVFWALLSDSDTFGTRYNAWSNISIHALNTVFALFEIIFTNSPPAPWLTMPICVIFGLAYLGVAYITHATQGFYPYSFLDPKKEGAKLAAFIIGIAVGEIIIFCVVRGIVVLRQRWAVRRGLVSVSESGYENGESEAANGRAIEDDWEEVERPSGPSTKGAV